MAVHASHAALPYPIKNARYTVLTAFLDADGDPTAPTTPDTELSKDNAAAADAAEEVSATSGMDGVGAITFTGAETNCSTLGVNFKVASGPKATLMTLYPRVLASVGTGTLSAGSAGGGTLGTLLAYDVTGCFVKTTGGTGGGGTGGANNQARKIATYNTSTGAFTVIPDWETTPDNTTTYEVLLPEGVTLGMLRTLNPTTPGRTADVTATGAVGVDWGNVENPTTAVALTGTTIAATQKVDVETIKTQAVSAAGAVVVGGFVGQGTAAIGVNASGHVSRVVLTDTVTTVTNQLAAATIAAAVEAAILNEGDATALLAAISAKVEEFLINEGDATATLAAIAAAVRTNLATELARIDAAISSRLATGPVTLADGAHGGTATVLTFSRLVGASVTTNEPAVKLTGNGTAPGLLSTGGASGNGMTLTGTTYGLRVSGGEDGISAFGINGNGMTLDGSNNGYGLSLNGFAADLDATLTSNGIPTAAANATQVWANGTRTLTAGTNIVLAKGTGVTGFNDLSAAQVTAAVPTAVQVATAVEAAILDEGDATALLAAIAAKVEEFVLNEGDSRAVMAGIAAAVWANATRTLSSGANINGSTFTAIPWNASWDAEVQSECADALTAFGASTLTSAQVNAEADAALADAGVTTVRQAKLDSLTFTTAGKIDAKLTSDGLDNLSATAPTAVATTFREKMLQVWERWFGKVVKDDDAGTIKVMQGTGSTPQTTQTFTSAAGVDTVNKAT